MFGSRARGDHRPGSDADVAVFIDETPDPIREPMDVAGGAYRVFLDADRPFSIAITHHDAGDEPGAGVASIDRVFWLDVDENIIEPATLPTVTGAGLLDWTHSTPPARRSASRAVGSRNISAGANIRRTAHTSTATICRGGWCCGCSICSGGRLGREAERETDWSTGPEAGYIDREFDSVGKVRWRT